MLLPQQLDDFSGEAAPVGFHVLEDVEVCIGDDKLVLEDLDGSANGKVLWGIKLRSINRAARFGHACELEKLATQNARISVVAIKGV